MKKNIEAIECDLCHKRWIEEDSLPKPEHSLLVRMIYRSTTGAPPPAPVKISYRDLCDDCFGHIEGSIKRAVSDRLMVYRPLGGVEKAPDER